MSIAVSVELFILLLVSLKSNLSIHIFANTPIHLPTRMHTRTTHMHVDVVIRQMSERNKAERPELVFEKMDLLQMTYDDAAFDLVLDKGTCDALCTDASPETRERMKKMFAEVARLCVCVCACVRACVRVCVCENCVYLILYTPQLLRRILQASSGPRV